MAVVSGEHQSGVAIVVLQLDLRAVPQCQLDQLLVAVRGGEAQRGATVAVLQREHGAPSQDVLVATPAGGEWSWHSCACCPAHAIRGKRRGTHCPAATAHTPVTLMPRRRCGGPLERALPLPWQLPLPAASLHLCSIEQEDYFYNYISSLNPSRPLTASRIAFFPSSPNLEFRRRSRNWLLHRTEMGHCEPSVRPRR